MLLSIYQSWLQKEKVSNQIPLIKSCSFPLLSSSGTNQVPILFKVYVYQCFKQLAIICTGKLFSSEMYTCSNVQQLSLPAQGDKKNRS